MRLLLDTHAFAWWVLGGSSLSSTALASLRSRETLIALSSVVPWELATKHRLGKWPEATEVLANLDETVSLARLTPLPITLAHARLAGSLSSPHKDPFDRMLAAQAILDDLVLVTADPAFQTLGCRTLW